MTKDKNRDRGSGVKSAGPAVIDREQGIGGRGTEIREIPLAALRVAPWNARKTFDAKALDEFTANVELHGIQVPLLVRPYAKQFYVSKGLFPEAESKVRYLACKNIAGHENILETFSHGAEEENRALAQAAADKQNGPGDYEIVAGHRRYRAGLKLNLPTVPCMVRDLSDDRTRELGLVDNLQREDVPALEEADAYAELRERLGTPAAIAARVGKDVSYVARRLQLVSLAELPRKALAERLITIDHALLLARLGDDEQDENLKWTLNTNAGMKVSVESVIAERIKDRSDKGSRGRGLWEPQSVLSLKNRIEEHVGRKLSRAPWNLDDAKLVPDAPACDACPSNTKHNTTLFDDLAIAAATCENGGCFETKRAAFVQLRLSDATHKQDPALGPALRVSWRPTSVKPRMAKEGDGFNLLQLFKAGQWIEAKPKSCEHLRLAVTVDWSDDANRGYMGSNEKLRKPGQVLTVCVAEKCKAHPKDWEKAKANANGSRGDEKAEAAKREAKAAAAREETKLRMAAASKALEGVSGLPAEAVRALGVSALQGFGSRRAGLNAMLPGIEKVLATAKVNSIEFAKAVALLALDDLICSEYEAPEESRKYFVQSLKRLGYAGVLPWKKQTAKKGGTK